MIRRYVANCLRVNNFQEIISTEGTADLASV